MIILPSYKGIIIVKHYKDHIRIPIITPILGEMIQFDWYIFQMGWNYQLVDDNKFSSWHVKLNIPMYKCMYNTIAYILKRHNWCIISLINGMTVLIPLAQLTAPKRA